MDITPITIWREARGEGEQGMAAVANVINNRILNQGKLWPKDPEQACLQPYQFSCWNNNSSIATMYPSATDTQYEIAQHIWKNLKDYPDQTGGATYYRNVEVAGPFPDNYKVTVVIGKHTFAKQANQQGLKRPT